jgi:4-hydroxy-2-oxoheptanedioate aldolase
MGTCDLRPRVGTASVGPWLSIPHFAVVESFALRRPDFLLLDGEHGLIETVHLGPLVVAAELAEIPVVFRVRDNRRDLIQPVLDLGIHAVLVPMVNSAAEAASALGAMRYPPAGTRGTGPLRASRYYGQYDAYLSSANRRVVSILQIETAAAVDNIEAIAALSGLDILYIGPADLKQSLSQGSLPFAEASERVVAAAKRHGVALGTDVLSESDIPVLLESGFTFMTWGSELSFIQDGAVAMLRSWSRMREVSDR